MKAAGFRDQRLEVKSPKVMQVVDGKVSPLPFNEPKISIRAVKRSKSSIQAPFADRIELKGQSVKLNS